MSSELWLEQLREWVVEIRAAFDALMEHQTLAVRKHARQGQFFRLCLEHTLGTSPGAFPINGPQQLAQFKFEVEDKLRRFYLRHGAPVEFVFLLVHRRDAARDQLIVDAHYPDTADYCLLVRDRRDPRWLVGGGEHPAGAAIQHTASPAQIGRRVVLAGNVRRAYWGRLAGKRTQAYADIHAGVQAACGGQYDP